MAGPRTQADLSDAVGRDLTWRIREISDLRTAARRADADLCNAIVRAGVTMLAAHWEGHVRFVAEQYLAFLTMRKPRFRDLKPAFLLGKFNPYFLPGGTPSGYAARISFLSEVQNASGDRFTQFSPGLVGARSNLRADVLKDICLALSIDPGHFAADTDFIDRILMHRRNAIAHGEQMSVDLDDFLETSDRTIDIMRRFKNIVENDMVLEAYRLKPAASPSQGVRMGRP